MKHNMAEFFENQLFCKNVDYFQVVEVKVNIANLKRQSIAQLRSGIFWVIGQGLSGLKIRGKLAKRKLGPFFPSKRGS